MFYRCYCCCCCYFGLTQHFLGCLRVKSGASHCQTKCKMYATCFSIPPSWPYFVVLLLLLLLFQCFSVFLFFHFLHLQCKCVALCYVCASFQMTFYCNAGSMRKKTIDKHFYITVALFIALNVSCTTLYDRTGLSIYYVCAVCSLTKSECVCVSYCFF